MKGHRRWGTFLTKACSTEAPSEGASKYEILQWESLRKKDGWGFVKVRVCMCAYVCMFVQAPHAMRGVRGKHGPLHVTPSAAGCVACGCMAPQDVSLRHGSDDIISHARCFCCCCFCFCFCFCCHLPCSGAWAWAGKVACRVVPRPMVLLKSDGRRLAGVAGWMQSERCTSIHQSISP